MCAGAPGAQRRGARRARRRVDKLERAQSRTRPRAACHAPRAPRPFGVLDRCMAGCAPGDACRTRGGARTSPAIVFALLLPI